MLAFLTKCYGDVTKLQTSVIMIDAKAETADRFHIHSFIKFI